MYGMEEICAITGKPAWLWYLAANFLSVVVASGIWFGVPVESGAVWGGFVALVLIAGLCFGVTCYYLKKRANDPDCTHSFKELLWAVTYKNMALMKERLQPHIRLVPWVWCFLVKQLIPHILIILFVNLAASDTDKGRPVFSGYGGYAMAPYQVLGILTFIFVTILFVAGFGFPGVYKWLDLTNREKEEEVMKGDDIDPTNKITSLRDEEAAKVLEDSPDEGAETPPVQEEDVIVEA